VPGRAPWPQGGRLATESVAVLFTDIVGSTELASNLAPDVADELRRGHFSVPRQTIAEVGGTEVKNLGDGLMMVFPVASAALRCAVLMQQGVSLDNRRRQQELIGLRVGLSGGESPSRTPITSGIPSWKRPGCARFARADRCWPRRFFGEWPVVETGLSGNQSAPFH
jgi:class 3 adenylate cyclase